MYTHGHLIVDQSTQKLHQSKRISLFSSTKITGYPQVETKTQTLSFSMYKSKQTKKQTKPHLKCIEDLNGKIQDFETDRKTNSRKLIQARGIDKGFLQRISIGKSLNS